MSEVTKKREKVTTPQAKPDAAPRGDSSYAFKNSIKVYCSFEKLLFETCQSWESSALLHLTAEGHGDEDQGGEEGDLGPPVHQGVQPGQHARCSIVKCKYFCDERWFYLPS